MVANQRPNFCQSCGAPQGSAVKKPVAVKQPEPEEEEYEEEEDSKELPTSIRVHIEGVPNRAEGIAMKYLIGTSEPSEKIYRNPVKGDLMNRIKNKTDRTSIEIRV